MKSLQLAVVDYLKINKIKKRDFAAIIGVTPVKLSHWFNGRALLDRYTIDTINRLLQNNN